MRLWRITRNAYRTAALDGMGGLYVAGRWNPLGLKMAYLSSTPALCQLELLANITLRDALDQYVLIAVEVPDHIVQDIDVSVLAGTRKQALNSNHWKDSVELTRSIGAAWIKEKASAVLQVPSVLGPWPYEFNALFNPDHPDAEQVKVENIRAFTFDGRLATVSDR